MRRLISLARFLKRRLLGSRQVVLVPTRRPSDRGAPPVHELRAANAAIGADPENFVLYRVIGNDLVPRHAPGQCRTNLRYILDNEPEFPNCEKRFVVNRIVDPDEETTILALLADAGMPYLHLPFHWEEYRRQPWDVLGIPVEYAPYTERFRQLSEAQQGRILMRLYRHKNNYVMNNNGARNAALREGRALAKSVMPWDGNCFLTKEAWDEIKAGVAANGDALYHIVPMARVTDNDLLRVPGFRPAAEEEPQILFRRDAAAEFDSEYFYGRRPKVELLWRLGVPGRWDDWSIEPWDMPCPEYCADAGRFATHGWVARLSSGQAELEEGDRRQALVGRGLARVDAVLSMLDGLDAQVRPAVQDQGWRPIQSRHQSARDDRDHAGFWEGLRLAADAALARGPYSVVQKTSLPPSSNLHDYWHPAPYYWPHPSRIPGLPYVRRDGRRVPGTRLYEPLSDRYDRTRLQRMFDDTFVLSLSWMCFGEESYAAHAASLVRTWFIDPKTAMTPHLEYAQVRKGHNRNRGNSSGIIEMKDLYYFLYAVRHLQDGNALSERDAVVLADWMERYLQWLRESEQGLKERASANNHGTFYDLQVASVAAFLGKDDIVGATLRDSYSRILEQFQPDGSQPRELARPTTAHYCCFNIQGWVQLATLAEAYGEDLWTFEAPDGRGLKQGIEWLLGHMGQEWPYEQIDEFDDDRFLPILHAYEAAYGGKRMPHTKSIEPAEAKPVFFPHDGIPPFWQIGLLSGETAWSVTDKKGPIAG